MPFVDFAISFRKASPAFRPANPKANLLTLFLMHYPWVREESIIKDKRQKYKDKRLNQRQSTFVTTFNYLWWLKEASVDEESENKEKA